MGFAAKMPLPSPWCTLERLRIVERTVKFIVHLRAIFAVIARIAVAHDSAFLSHLALALAAAHMPTRARALRGILLAFYLSRLVVGTSLVQISIVAIILSRSLRRLRRDHCQE